MFMEAKQFHLSFCGRKTEDILKFEILALILVCKYEKDQKLK
jgi:hypothetical protein